MAFEELTFEKSWENPAQFPQYETDETQVRKDLQYHPDAIKNYINGTLLKALQASTAAANIGDSFTGTVAGTLQSMDAGIADLRRDIENIQLGEAPESIRAVEVTFESSEWTWADWIGAYVLIIAPDTHKRTGPGFGYTINLWDGYRLRSGLWATAGTGVFYEQSNQYIALVSDCTYKGSVVFFGV